MFLATAVLCYYGYFKKFGVKSKSEVNWNKNNSIYVSQFIEWESSK